MAANPLQKLAPQTVATGPRIVFAASIIVVGAFAAITHYTLPGAVLLPATVTFIFLLAAAIALFASRGPAPPQFTYWEAAGLLTAIGIMASVMVEPEDLVRLVVDADRRD
jgi:hypothetical protein